MQALRAWKSSHVVKDKKTVLVVEDEFVIAEMLTEVLEEEGYHVLTASNGLVALSHLREHPVDLVLSDVMMPLLEGRELVQRMRAEPAWRSIPVILVTAAPSLVLADGNHTALVRKPFDPDVVLELVDRLIEEQSDQAR
jgi:CheY-like chemotaxis protein